jgi:hypothetical protein
MTSAGVMEAKAGPFGAAGSETQTGLSAKAFLLLSPCRIQKRIS